MDGCGVFNRLAIHFVARLSRDIAMKFRFVFFGSDSPNDTIPLSNPSFEASRGTSHVRPYAKTTIGMVRVEKSKDGSSKVIELTNFNARIIGDLIIQDGEE